MSERLTRGRKRKTPGHLRSNANFEDIQIERIFSLGKHSSQTAEEDSLKTGGRSYVKENGTDQQGQSVQSQRRGHHDEQQQQQGALGECCYVSTTINSRRYYGVLIDQEALKEASNLHFEDEASSLELNQRMVALQKQSEAQVLSQSHGQCQTQGQDQGHSQCRPSIGNREKDIDCDVKKICNRDKDEKITFELDRQVQKFRYVEENSKIAIGGYREIIATYADVLAASEDDRKRAWLIQEACESGGNWVGKYYYQYEVLSSTLEVVGDESGDKTSKSAVLHTSMSFDNFLYNTKLPSWYPLRNITTSRKKIMSMFNLKYDTKGSVRWKGRAEKVNDAVTTSPRMHFRVGIVGAGLGGLGCAQELFRLGEKEGIDLEVKLYEARDRVGGRCCTDNVTFTQKEGGSFPVDLGAGWIHGTTGNPLVPLARAAGNKMCPQGIGVKMLMGDMKEANRSADERVRKIFDDILEQGAKDAWGKEDLDLDLRFQKATRFYAEQLEGNGNHQDRIRTDAALHRYSSDTSVGLAMKKAAAASHLQLSTIEKNLLEWTTKHTEYSFGANLDSLSMRYWDADDEHALEGKHVTLKDGYSSLATELLSQCEMKTKKFELLLSNPVSAIDYDVKCFARPSQHGRHQLLGVSDSCRITSRHGGRVESFDFAVCALPLGILKSSINSNGDGSRVRFVPDLPDTKKDSIEHVGFGILNKVFLQFPHSFWRKRGQESDLAGTPFLSDEKSSFGNASSLNQHHYLFYDVGFNKENPDNMKDPSILYTLISGHDAIKSETQTDAAVVESTMSTIRHLFSGISIPSPSAYKVTRWASDQYSKGSYSFLPPGTSEEDYLSLQSPVCGSGDQFSVGRSEPMRLFFAGEHTSLQYPSMAHGALVSGIRAARDIFTNIQIDKGRSRGPSDRLVPLTRFRMKFPKSPILCHLCKLPRTDKEGAVLVFQRERGGMALIHRNCAEFSPDVQLSGSHWRGVFKCINRGKQLKCVKCGKNGGTIGCSQEDCRNNYHFGCIDDEWNFEKDGKEFICKMHRKIKEVSSKQQTTRNDNSLELNTFQRSVNPHEQHADYEAMTFLQFRFRYPGAVLKCALCNTSDERNNHLLGFRRGEHSTLVHESCLQHTNIVQKESLVTNRPSTMHRNTVFDIIKSSKTCYQCKKPGATIRCKMESCMKYYHYGCCSEWNSNVVGASFLCRDHCRLQVQPQNSASSINVAIRKFELTASSHDLKSSIPEAANGATYPLMTKANKCNTTSPLEDSSRQREEQPKNEGRITMNSVEQSGKHSSASNPNSIQFKSKGNRESAYGTKNNAITAKAMHPQESSAVMIKSALNKDSAMLSAGTKNRVNELLPDTKIVHDLCHEGALTCHKNAISGNGGGRNRRRNYGPSNDFAIPPTVEDATMKEYSNQETDLNSKKGSKHESKHLGTFDFVRTSGNNIITNSDSGRYIALKSVETEDQGKADATYQSINKDDDDENWDEEESSLGSEEEGSSLLV